MTILYTHTNIQVGSVGIDDTFHKGLKAYREGNYPDAIQLLKNAVAENEANHKAWNALGVTYSKIGRIEEAVSCYENALKYDPGNTSYEQNRDQIVKKAFSRLPSSPLSRGQGNAGVDYRRIFIPVILLVLVVSIALYVLFISSSIGPDLMNGRQSSPVSPDETDGEIIPESTPEMSDEPAAVPETTPEPATTKTASPLVIVGDLTGKYYKGLSEVTFFIGIPEGGTPQYLPRVNYLWSVGSLDPVLVVPANPASGTMKPGETLMVTLQIPVHLQPRAGEKFSLEIRPPSGNPVSLTSTLPNDYVGGKISNPMISSPHSSLPPSSGVPPSEMPPAEDSGSNLALEGSLNGFYSSELEELTFTLRALATGPPQDLSRITYSWNVGSDVPVKISRIQPLSGTINPGEQQLVTISIPEGKRPLSGESFTLEIKPENGQSLLVKKALSSGYQGGIIP
jgi:archaellin